jgi:hypothetical protein
MRESSPTRVRPRRNVDGSSVVSSAELDVGLDERARGVDDGDASAHVRLEDPPLGERACTRARSTRSLTPKSTLGSSTGVRRDAVEQARSCP